MSAHANLKVFGETDVGWCACARTAGACKVRQRWSNPVLVIACLALMANMATVGAARAQAAKSTTAGTPAAAETGGDTSDVSAFTAKVTAQLKLNPQQQAAFLAFEALMVDRTQPAPADPDAFRAMSLTQKLDYIEERAASAESKMRAADQAAHRLYDLLSPDQRSTLDALMFTQKGSVAPAETPLPASLSLNSTQPGRTEPAWLVVPPADQIARLYPRDAKRRHITGSTLVHCTVDTDGYLSDCTVTGEEPKSAGFGNAALQITSYMRMKPATLNGVPVEAAVNVPVSFNF
jgi:TonB family protein